MDLLLFILILLSFPIMYKFNRMWFYIYSFIFSCVALFVFSKLGFSLAYTILNAQFISQFVMIFIFKNYNQYKHIYIPFICVYLLYLFFVSVYQDVPFLMRWNSYKISFIFMTLGLMLLDDIKDRKVSSIKLRHFFMAFVLFEIILGILQYFILPVGEYFRNVQYVREGKVVQLLDVSAVGYVVGTFKGKTPYGNFLSTCFVILCLYFFSHGKVTAKKWMFLIFIGFAILLSGVRASFLLSLIVLGLSIWIYQRNLKSLIVVCGIFVCFVLVGNPLETIEDLRQVGYDEGGIKRSLTLFNSFNGEVLNTETTFAMTYNMIPYVLKNPLFGIGLHYKGGYLLPFYNQYLETFSTTDAQLFFTLAEIGLLGSLIYIVPFLYYIRIIKKRRYSYKNCIILFFSLLFMTIVDSGLFDSSVLMVFFFSSVFWVSKPLSLDGKTLKTIIEQKRNRTFVKVHNICNVRKTNIAK